MKTRLREFMEKKFVLIKKQSIVLDGVKKNGWIADEASLKEMIAVKSEMDTLNSKYSDVREEVYQ